MEKNNEFIEIPNTNGLYFVNNIGQVMRNGAILKPVMRNGYNTVSISLNGKVKRHYVHRLVLLVFMENIENKPCVNHKNGIRNDNRLENLEWTTYRENIKHAFDELGRKNIGLKGSLNGNYKNRGFSHISSKSVICSNGKTYGSRKEAARELKVNAGNITSVCNNRTKQTGGYTFKWA